MSTSRLASLPTFFGACGLLLGAAAAPVFALDQSKNPAGMNHAAAHVRATGAGIPIGILETGLVDTPFSQVHFDGRLIRNLDFTTSLTRVTTDPPANPVLASSHATQVTEVAGSSHATFTGVAPDALLYVGATTGAISRFNAADYLYREYGVSVFNISLGMGNPTSGSTKIEFALDYHMQAFDTLFIKSAGNRGNSDGEITIPGGFHNGLTVGALSTNFLTRASFSSYLMSGEDGDTPNPWPKPEIVAPGTNIGTPAYGPVSGTSVAAPHVTGLVALLQEGTSNAPGLILGQAGQSNHIAIKAIIMNSARKRHIVGPDNDFPFAFDLSTTSNQASDGNYLNGMTFREGDQTTAPRTQFWTPSAWSYDGDIFSTSAPLDDELGAGVVDAVRALNQLEGGQQGPGAVDPVGWGLETISTGMFHDYVLGVPIAGMGEFLTVTMTWDRPMFWLDGGEAGLEYNGDSFFAFALPNLELRIFYMGELYAESVSLFNVEHLHIPLIHAGGIGDYLIRVDAVSNANNTPYALAWMVAVPEPGTSALLLIAIIGLLAAHRHRAFIRFRSRRP